MLNRAFTFNNSKIVAKLKESFIPYAGNTAELQRLYRSEYDVADWFEKMSDQTKFAVQGETRQGMYIAGADGTAYGWKNTPGISDTLRFMDRGLKEFERKPPGKIEIAQKEIDQPFAKAPKPFTSVIAVYSRVRPVPEGSDNRNHNLGRDYFWIARDEVREMLAAQTPELPQALIARMVRYVLVDNIRGEPAYWEPKEIQRADFSLKRVESDDGHHSFRFRGEVDCHTFWLTRGIKGVIEGEFVLDEVTGMVNRFRAYSKCSAWGTSEWAARGMPRQVFTLVFGMKEEHDPILREIPPSALSRKQEYSTPNIPKKR